MNRILVVDDERELRALLQERLEEESYAVDTAIDGRDALDKLDQVTYDVFASIIVCSGDLLAIQQAVHMGISYTLLKPFDLEVLLTMVANRAACGQGSARSKDMIQSF